MSSEPDELELDKLDPETRRKVLALLLAEAEREADQKASQEEKRDAGPGERAAEPKGKIRPWPKAMVFALVLVAAACLWPALSYRYHRASAPPSGSPQVIMHLGDRGPKVEDLQKALNELGAKLAVDGVFGEDTLKAWQVVSGASKETIDENEWQNLQKELQKCRSDPNYARLMASHFAQVYRDQQAPQPQPRQVTQPKTIIKPSEDQIRFVMGHTLPTNRPERFLNGDPAWRNYFGPCSELVTVPDGYGGYLSAIVGAWSGSADGGCELVFFWHNDRFLGFDSIYGYSFPRISASGNTIAVTYPTWPEGMTFAEFSNQAYRLPGPVVKFWWDGSRLVNSGNLESIFLGYKGPGFGYFPEKE